MTDLSVPGREADPANEERGENVRARGLLEGWTPGVRSSLSRRDVLRWLYVGRLTLVTGVLVAALLAWGQAEPEQTFLATAAFLAALGVTGGGFWYTHILGRAPGANLLYSQIAFDVLVVTAVVHMTGGGESNFVWVYILVISAGALLLPLYGGLLIGVLASILYFAVVVWGHSETLTGGVLVQLGLFAVVAVVTGVLGDRLRRAGTALGQVESELERLRMDTGEILDTIATAVLAVDGRGRVAYVNPAAQAILGLRGEEWLGASVAEALKDRAPELAVLIEKTLEDGVPLRRRRASVQTSDGSRTLGVSTTVQQGQEGPRTVTAIFQDITELERMEALNRRNERLEAVAELSASMAHEIKNPLASIRSAVEQFARDGLSADDRASLTRMVVSESERLSRLLSEFIDFSGLRRGQVSGMDLSEVLAECITAVEQHPDCSGRGVRLRTKGLEASVPVCADPDLMHRALFNLLLNAVQFSPEGGEVEVELEDLSAGAGSAGFNGEAGHGIPDPIRISVRDSGPGVEPAEVGRIFDPFYTTRRGGSGLGLAVVHRAVEAHDGAVWVERASRGGAEFQVFLPKGEVMEKES